MLTFTDKAREMVLSFMGDEPDGQQALRVKMDGSPFAPSFELTLVGSADLADDDVTMDGGGFTVFVDGASAPKLKGATVDFIDELNQSGFEVKTSPDADGRGGGGPTGPIAERVTDLLNRQVNPSIAAHGGEIRLVDVQETEIYLEMMGGCQGCAMSRLTLRQGVEKMIHQSIPEVTAIHDITDHQAGENPFFS